MSRAQTIETILREHLQPTRLEVRDVSYKHAGHAGARPEGETHFELVIESLHFSKMNKVQRHQAVYALLSAQFEQGLHALSIEAIAPLTN